MNDGRRRERASPRASRLRRAFVWPLRDESHDDELQSDEGARGRADNDVEVFPNDEFVHDRDYSPNRRSGRNYRAP